MNKFITQSIKDDIKYLINDPILRKKIYNASSPFMRANYKLKKTGLIGTTKEYKSRLQTIKKNILETSSLLDNPVTYYFPAPYDVIAWLLREDIEKIIEDTDLAKYIINTIMGNSRETKLRRYQAPSHFYFYDETTKTDEVMLSDLFYDCMLTYNDYEIAISIVQCSEELIYNRDFIDSDTEKYMEHPLFKY